MKLLLLELTLHGAFRRKRIFHYFLWFRWKCRKTFYRWHGRIFWYLKSMIYRTSIGCSFPMHCFSIGYPISNHSPGTRGYFLWKLFFRFKKEHDPENRGIVSSTMASHELRHAPRDLPRLVFLFGQKSFSVYGLCVSFPLPRPPDLRTEWWFWHYT